VICSSKKDTREKAGDDRQKDKMMSSETGNDPNRDLQESFADLYFLLKIEELKKFISFNH